MFSSIKVLSKLQPFVFTFWMLFAGCEKSEFPETLDPDQGTRIPVAIQLNWYPEPEHGGPYAALDQGLYAAAGLDVEIRPGGRAAPVAAELAMGRCQFAITSADDVVLYRQQGADVVAVLAAVQNHPRCILVRSDSGIDSLKSLQGVTLQRQPGRPFLEFLRHRGLLKGVQEVPYNGSVAQLVTSKQIAIQAYSYAEPFLAEQQGVAVRPLMVSDLGWNPYSSVLLTTGALVRDQPDLVRQVVQATRAGWVQYLTNPSGANRLILEANQHGMTKQALVYGAQKLRTLALPDKASLADVGQMSLKRWQVLVDQMKQLKLATADGVEPSACFTTQFLEPASP